jgi:hypothetical protein
MYVTSPELKFDNSRVCNLVTGCSESSLRVVGHMAKDILKWATLKNIEN